jgi:ABC-2 type transport system ATP-binding protein
MKARRTADDDDAARQARGSAIRTEQLTKSYGPNRGVFELALRVERGEIFGFLGPNGAGKTTTIRLLMGLTRPDAGRAFIFGLDIQAAAVAIHRRVGYLPGEFALDPHLTGRQALTYLSNLRGGIDWPHLETLRQRLDLDLDRPFGQYSHGNKQKVGLIQAFMHRPELLILDEPTSGLDPLNQETVAELVREARADGATVFLSSHVLAEVEALCERVGFVREGRLMSVSSVHDLLKLRAHEVEVEFAEASPAEAFIDVKGLSDVRMTDNTLRCLVHGEMDELIKTLGRYRILRMTSREPSLNDVFLRLYGDGAAARVGESDDGAGTPERAGEG